ncbi:MAG: hypothetical protein ABIR57_00890 [Aeromicrobium sp.]
MISRRALIGTGAGVVVAAGAAATGAHTHRLDDLARTVGVDPRRRPALSDEALIKRVQADQSVLVLWTQAVSSRQPGLSPSLKPLIAITKTQLEDLGGALTTINVEAPPASPKAALDVVIDVYLRAEKNRSRETIEAISGDFAQVLASIAASLAQSIVVLNKARKSLA